MSQSKRQPQTRPASAAPSAWGTWSRALSAILARMPPPSCCQRLPATRLTRQQCTMDLYGMLRVLRLEFSGLLASGLGASACVCAPLVWERLSSGVSLPDQCITIMFDPPLCLNLYATAYLFARIPTGGGAFCQCTGSTTTCIPANTNRKAAN